MPPIYVCRREKTKIFLRLAVTRIVDLTCLSAGRKEIDAFVVGIYTILVCSSLRRHALTQ